MTSTTPALPTPGLPAFEGGEVEREQAQREYDEALARLRRVRATWFLLYGQIRRCLDILGDRAQEAVGAQGLQELRERAEALSLEPSADVPEVEEGMSDPALAWMEPEPVHEASDAPPSLPPPPSPEEEARALKTLRQCLEYLETANRSTPDLHLSILQAEEKLKRLDALRGGRLEAGPVGSCEPVA